MKKFDLILDREAMKAARIACESRMKGLKKQMRASGHGVASDEEIEKRVLKARLSAIYFLASGGLSCNHMKVYVGISPFEPWETRVSQAFTERLQPALDTFAPKSRHLLSELVTAATAHYVASHKRPEKPIAAPAAA